MARLTKENEALSREIIERYPRKRSALIPLLHVAQGQDGLITDDAMVHIAELLDLTPAEVWGTCSFYEMFKRHPTGKYLVNVCTNLPCMLRGGYQLLEDFEDLLGVQPGGITSDAVFTLEEVECLAACPEAPAVQVNYRYFNGLNRDTAEQLLDDLVAGRLDDEVPSHGTTTRVRQQRSANWAGNIGEGIDEVRS